MSAEPSATAWLLDRPETLAGLFYPRPDFAEDTSADARELSIPVAEGVVVGARCHLADSEATTILFFHGNGGIVRDYDDIGALYVERGINFVAVDYRVTAVPPAARPLRRCWPTVMSSSMLSRTGSVSRDTPGRCSSWGARWQRLGPGTGLPPFRPNRRVDPGERLRPYRTAVAPDRRQPRPAAGIRGNQGFRQLDKIRTFAKPTLVIHAEYDHLIPLRRRSGPVRRQSRPGQASTEDSTPRRSQHHFRRLAAVSGFGRKFRRSTPLRSRRLSGRNGLREVVI